MILTKEKEIVSLQVSVLNEVNTGDTNFNIPVLLKNITDSNIEVLIKTTDNSDYITTIIYPGWNPELVIAIKGAPSGLQCGY